MVAKESGRGFGEEREGEISGGSLGVHKEWGPELKSSQSCDGFVDIQLGGR